MQPIVAQKSSSRAGVTLRGASELATAAASARLVERVEPRAGKASLARDPEGAVA